MRHPALISLLLGVVVAWLLPTLPQQTQKTPPRPLPEVRALLDKGIAQQQAGHMEEARKFYEEALITARASKDRTGEGRALLGMGAVVVFTAPKEAREKLEQALSITREIGDRTNEAQCLMNLGMASSLLSDPDRALAHYQAVLQIHKERGNKAAQASVLNAIGYQYRELGLSAKALEYLLAATALIREVGGPSVRNALALSQLNIGLSYFDLGDTDRAMENLEESRKLSREEGYSQVEARALMNIGAVHSALGNTAKALDCTREAQTLCEAAGDRQAAAYCIQNAGQIRYAEGDLLAFLEASHQALAIYQQLGDRRSESRDLGDMAWFYHSIGQPEEAARHFEMALEANKQIQDDGGRIHMLFNLGRAYGENGQLQREKRCCDEALALSGKVEGKTNQAEVQLLLGHYQRRMGRPKEAAMSLQKGREFCREAGDRQLEVTAELEIGLTAMSSRDLGLARRQFERVADIARAAANATDEAAALEQIGVIDELENRPTSAEQTYARALAVREGSRASLGALSDAKLGYQATQSALYQRYISLLLRTGQDRKAFEWTQKAKARVLLDMMEIGRVDISQAMTDSDRKQEQVLKRREKLLTHQLEVATDAVDKQRRTPQADGKTVAQASERADEIRRQQQSLEREWSAARRQMYLRNPTLAQQRAARVATLDEVAAALPVDTVLLEYCYLGAREGAKRVDEVAIFAIGRDGSRSRFTSFRVRASVGTVVRLAADLRNACAGRPGSAGERPYKDLSRRLYRQLIAPAEQAIAGSKRLVICPDGPLWDVPFQVLLASAADDGSAAVRKTTTLPGSSSAEHARFLWERFSLVYGCSATGVRAVLDAKNRPGRIRPPNAMLVVADPAAETADRVTTASVRGAAHADTSDLRRGVYERAGRLGALPYARVEANAILAMFPEAALKLGGDAQESFVKQSASLYRYIHFATHAIVNDSAPTLSGVVLARPPKESPEDGVLTVRELFGMSLSADLIVFSACDTARGAKKRGEGLIGLTWAAFVAGVPTQVVSQWSVDDAATAQLMEGFYRGLKRGESKDAAFRKAALAIVRDGKHSHPFYWAPFVVIGDWR